MRPPTEHADRILGIWWAAGDEMAGLPADCSRRAAALSALAARVAATAVDGQVGSEQLLNFGSGELAETISATWLRHFGRMEMEAARVATAATTLESWALTTGALVMHWADVVWRAEAAIETVRAQALTAGMDPTPIIDTLITEAHGEVA
ncbi:MAG: hypothetical protein O3A42_19495, partial [Actinobacteria bacterium]|nr:hypothetical protein [Actinomycetota bacterium]